MTLGIWHVKGQHIVGPEHAYWADFFEGDRLCSFCGLPCIPEDHPVTSKDGEHYAHFTCWYGNGPIPPQRYTSLYGGTP